VKSFLVLFPLVCSGDDDCRHRDVKFQPNLIFDFRGWTQSNKVLQALRVLIAFSSWVKDNPAGAAPMKVSGRGLDIFEPWDRRFPSSLLLETFMCHLDRPRISHRDCLQSPPGTWLKSYTGLLRSTLLWNEKIHPPPPANIVDSSLSWLLNRKMHGFPLGTLGDHIILAYAIQFTEVSWRSNRLNGDELDPSSQAQMGAVPFGDP
jgi:hypothetical protein